MELWGFGRLGGLLVGLPAPKGSTVYLILYHRAIPYQLGSIAPIVSRQGPGRQTDVDMPIGSKLGMSF